MKYDEATKLIKGLSQKYSIDNNGKRYFEIIYKSKSIAWVDKLQQFNFGKVNISNFKFDKMPYSHKLWMILSELAMTPIGERNECERHVIIANDPNNGEHSYTEWFETQNRSDAFNYSKQDLAVFENTRFTNKKFDGLIKYLKSLPDGE